MFFFWRRPEGPRRIKDTCLLCALPVYDDEPALDFLGIWMHRPCYDRDLQLGVSARDDSNRFGGGKLRPAA